MSESTLPKKKFTNSVLWNLILLATGVTVYAVGAKSIAFYHQFIPGGLFGTAMLVDFATAYRFSPSFFYFFLNIPLFILGWIMLSRRFIWYTLFGILATTIVSELITYEIVIKDPMLAAIATGMLCGAGCGIVIRSVGSDGGTTILAIILNQKFNMRLGQVTFLYNVVLFICALTIIDVDNVLYSLVIVFIMASVMDYFGSLFNHRKMVLIVSSKHKEIAEDIMKSGRGVTYIDARGAYTQESRVIIMTVVQNFQLKRMEEIVFAHDPQAFMIVENTFNVLGSGFSHRKTY